MEEIWKPIPGWEGYYEVSNLGRVKSKSRHVKRGTNTLFVSEKIKATHLSRGHCALHLSRNGRDVPVYVHQLVLLAFVGPCPDGMECRHFPDRNPLNNRLDNLQWGTHKQNMEDMVVQGSTVKGREVPLERRLKMRASAIARGVNSTKYSKETILEIRRLYSTGEWSYSKLVSHFNIPKSTIAQIVTEKTWKST